MIFNISRNFSMKMLASFVEQKDYQKLISILKKIYEGTLKDETSSILLYGISSGKSTLYDIMEQLAPSSGRVPVNMFCIDHGHQKPFAYVEECTKSLVFVHSEEYQDKIIEFYNMLYKYRGEFMENYITGEKTEFHPGVTVFLTNNKYEFPDKKWKRKPIYLHLPNTFKHNPKLLKKEIIKKCVKEFFEML